MIQLVLERLPVISDNLRDDKHRRLLRSVSRRDETKSQSEGYNVEFLIWLLFTKRAGRRKVKWIGGNEKAMAVAVVYANDRRKACPDCVVK